MIGLINQRQKATDKSTKIKKKLLGRKKKLISSRKLNKPVIKQETENLWQERDSQKPSALLNAPSEDIPVQFQNPENPETRSPEMAKPAPLPQIKPPPLLPPKEIKNTPISTKNTTEITSKIEEVFEVPQKPKSPPKKMIKSKITFPKKPILPKKKLRKETIKKQIPRKPIKHEDMNLFNDLDTATPKPAPREHNQFNLLREEEEEIKPDTEFYIGQNSQAKENWFQVEAPEAKQSSWGDLVEPAKPVESEYVIRDSSIQSREESNSFLDDETQETPVKAPPEPPTPQSQNSKFSNVQSQPSLREPTPVFQSLKNLQFINDKPYLQLNKSELNLNDLFLRMGVTQNGLLHLCSELVYQFHKYSLFSFPR